MCKTGRPFDYPSKNMILVLILSNRLLRSWRRCSPHSQPAQQTLPHKSGGTTGYSCHRTGPSLPVRTRKSINYSCGQKRHTITQLYKQERCSRLENKTSSISIMLKLTSFPSGCWHCFAEHTDQSSSESSEYDRSERELEVEVVRLSSLLLSLFILGFFFLGFFISSLCCPSMFSFSRRRLLFFSSLSGSFLLSGTPS